MSKTDRDRRIFLFLTNAVVPFFARKYRVKAEAYTPKKQPCVILANHTTDLDFLWTALSLKKHMYIVASDHLKRGRFGALLQFFFSPIWRLKSSSDITTIKRIVKTVNSGSNVLLFAEGNRSPSGANSPISDATGKLVKMCKAPLLTYRIEGGYFTQPRWAKNWRRGKMRGYVVGEYSAEDIAAMSAEEVNDIIARDLHENAYDTQKKDMTAYKGKDLAEYLETLLYICPECGATASLKSRGDKISCVCGMSQTIDEYGYFHGENGGKTYFDTVYEWDMYQKRELKSRKEKFTAASEAIFKDTNQILKNITDGKTAEGSFTAYRDRFEFISDSGETSAFKYADIHEIQVVGRQTVMFSVYALTYELSCEKPRSAYKYLDLYELMK